MVDQLREILVTVSAPWIQRGRENAVLTAFLISLVAHMMLFVGLEFAREVRLLEKLAQIPILKGLIASPSEASTDDVPLVFVQVDPSTVIEDVDIDSPFYSDVASRAADPTLGSTDQVEVDGEQTDMVRTFDSAKSDGSDSEAETDPVESPEVVEPEPGSEAAEASPDNPGGPPELSPGTDDPLPLMPSDRELAVDEALRVTPPREPRPAPTPAPERSRPRTIREARERLQMLDGQRMDSNGGVDEMYENPALSVKVTGFGAYDRMFIEAVDNRWKQLLTENHYALNKTGKVEVRFRLHQDGRITQLEVAESTVGAVLGLLCKRAILDPAPYRPWPDEMRRAIGEPFRDVRFSFYYN